MDFNTPHPLILKAWDQENRLLVRLDQVACVRGVLKRPHHILLLFTGLRDQQGEELYDRDVVLWDKDRWVIAWHAEASRWHLYQIKDGSPGTPLVAEVAARVIRLCSFFESGAAG